MTQLLRKSIPIVSAHAPGTLLGREHADGAMSAVKASSSYANIQGLTLVDGIDMLTDMQANLKSSRLFEENVNRLRGELYVGGHDDPQRRFELHQLLMVAGFYSRAANQHSTVSDPPRFLANHYNFDVRRDKVILGAVKDACFGEQPAAANNTLVGDLLLTERHLFGQHRLQPVAGRKYLLPGISLRLVKTEEELKRLLELEPVKNHGNFELASELDDKRVSTMTPPHANWDISQKLTKQDRWDAVVVRCKPEEETPIAPPLKLHAPTDDLGQFRLRVLRPAPPLTWREKITEVLLQLWVYWFGFWILFWLVDEEIITFVGLIAARYKQLALLKEEAKRTHGKVYIASSRFS